MIQWGRSLHERDTREGVAMEINIFMNVTIKESIIKWNVEWQLVTKPIVKENG